MEWSVKVIKLVRIILDVRYFNKRKEFFDLFDIEKIVVYFVREIKNLDFILNNSNEIVFWEVVVFVEVRLFLYNRRRLGELECFR